MSVQHLLRKPSDCVLVNRTYRPYKTPDPRIDRASPAAEWSNADSRWTETGGGNSAGLGLGHNRKPPQQGRDGWRVVEDAGGQFVGVDLLSSAEDAVDRISS